MKIFKRWREDKSKATFEVHVHNPRPDAEKVARDLLTYDRRGDRSKTDHPGVVSLEGDKWAVHASNGTVYLSGEDGIVQVQFAPVDAYSLGTLLQEAAQR